MSGNLFMLLLESGENSKGELVVKGLTVNLLGEYTFLIHVNICRKEKQIETSWFS